MGETSTAYLLTEPPFPILWESSLGPPVFTALMKTPSGFLSVWRWISSKVCWTIKQALSFFPQLRPWNIRASTKRSTMGHWVFLKRRIWYFPAVWGKKTCDFTVWKAMWSLNTRLELYTLFFLLPSFSPKSSRSSSQLSYSHLPKSLGTTLNKSSSSSKH